MARRSEEPDDRDDRDDRPRRKKKKGKAKKPGRKYLILGGAVGGVFLLVVAVVAAVLLGGRTKPAQATAPQEFSAHDSPEDVFNITLPDGWKTRSGGVKGSCWVSAEKGDATIKAQESLTGSLLGDIAGAAQPDPNVPDELLPISKVHEQKKGDVAADYTGYKEQPAVTVKTGFGKARQSAFIARAGLSGQVRGYRVTTMGALTQVTVVCVCPAGDWDAMKPVFTRAIESVTPGPAPTQAQAPAGK